MSKEWVRSILVLAVFGAVVFNAFVMGKLALILFSALSFLAVVALFALYDWANGRWFFH
jgi:hypothetical protein